MRTRKRIIVSEVPAVPQLEAELKRERYRNQSGKVLRSTIYTLITVAAVAVLIATLWLPVLQITGSSIEPTLESEQIVVALKNSPLQRGNCRLSNMLDSEGEESLMGRETLERAHRPVIGATVVNG